MEMATVTIEGYICAHQYEWEKQIAKLQALPYVPSETV